MERGPVREAADRAHDGRLPRSCRRGDRFWHNLAQSSPQHAVPEQGRRRVRDQGGRRSSVAEVQQTRRRVAAEYQAGGTGNPGAASGAGPIGCFRRDRATPAHRVPRRGCDERGAQAVSLGDPRTRDFTLLSCRLRDLLGNRLRVARIGTKRELESDRRAE